MAFFLDPHPTAASLMLTSEQGALAVLGGLRHSNSCLNAKFGMRWHAYYSGSPGAMSARRCHVSFIRGPTVTSGDDVVAGLCTVISSRGTSCGTT